MKTRLLLALGGIFVTAAAPAAGQDSEVSSCVSAIRAHLKIRNATRIRHVVEYRRQHGLASVFDVTTTVAGPAGQSRQFDSYCITTGFGEPLKLQVNETTADTD